MQKISWPLPANIDTSTVHRREIVQQECLEELINVIKKIINIDTDNDKKNDKTKTVPLVSKKQRNFAPS